MYERCFKPSTSVETMTSHLENGSATRGYRVELQYEEDGSWTVSVPDLPGCVSAGPSPDAAVASVGDAIDSWASAAEETGRLVPVPTEPDDEYSGRLLLRMPKGLHRAVASRARTEGVSLNTYSVTALTSAIAHGLVPDRAGPSVLQGRQSEAPKHIVTFVRTGSFGPQTTLPRGRVGGASTPHQYYAAFSGQPETRKVPA